MRFIVRALLTAVLAVVALGLFAPDLVLALGRQTPVFPWLLSVTKSAGNNSPDWLFEASALSIFASLYLLIYLVLLARNAYSIPLGRVPQMLDESDQRGALRYFLLGRNGYSPPLLGEDKPQQEPGMLVPVMDLLLSYGKTRAALVTIASDVLIVAVGAMLIDDASKTYSENTFWGRSFDVLIIVVAVHVAFSLLCTLTYVAYAYLCTLIMRRETN